MCVVITPNDIILLLLMLIYTLTPTSVQVVSIHPSACYEIPIGSHFFRRFHRNKKNDIESRVDRNLDSNVSFTRSTHLMLSLVVKTFQVHRKKTHSFYSTISNVLGAVQCIRKHFSIFYLCLCVRNFYFHHIFNHFIADHSIEYIVKFIYFFFVPLGAMLCDAKLRSHRMLSVFIRCDFSPISVCMSNVIEGGGWWHLVNVANRFMAA